MKNTKSEKYKFPYISVKQERHAFILTALPVSILTNISYVAVRRQSQERGAVQRVLNQSRIGSIKEFAQNGGDFPASIVLNWVGDEIIKDSRNITIKKKKIRHRSSMDSTELSA